MSGFGETIGKLYESASEAARNGARSMMSSLASAAGAVKDGLFAAGSATANVGGFAARAVGETAASAATAPYRGLKAVYSLTQSPRERLAEPCPASWEAKKQRVLEREALAASGSKSPDPNVREAAQRLSRNTESVELAKLSEDTYDQYPPKPGHTPPLGWKEMSDAELAELNISKDMLDKSQAVLYKTETDWPGGQKTVLAFRGTADLEDAIVDHDQAMGLATAQYENASELGKVVGKQLGKDVMVTGHSLGGGKAQAAGVTGGMRGMMFNSAGLHPESVGGMAPAPGQFQQYRTPGDPLTGMQNSPALQTAVAAIAGVVAMPLGAGMKLGDKASKAAGMQGLSPEYADYADKALKALPRGLKNLVSDGNVLPPAIGKVTEVPSLNEEGEALGKLNPKQHSITFLVNGIEREKSEDLATLRAS